MSAKRIGIYGGTFSPPHLGHRRAVEAFALAEQLDEIYVIPTFTPPHKQLQGDATPQQRMEMCRLAFAGLPVTVSDLEIRRGGKSYTVLTLEELKAPDNTLVLLCGTDMFLTIDSWYQAARIFELAEIVYVQRETGLLGEESAIKLARKRVELQEKYHAVARPLPCDTMMISSSELRAMLEKGENTDAYVDSTVRGYIDQWNLYRA
jgi:nicotinate-nucleotide adenylyltransferase